MSYSSSLSVNFQVNVILSELIPPSKNGGIGGFGCDASKVITIPVVMYVLYVVGSPTEGGALIVVSVPAPAMTPGPNSLDAKTRK